ncbi:putative quinol monooxygenase [Nocardia sp. NPDC058058]|uniref:putative quinol monooxygenase n=1 Tax=Nocardia sp. NPDC058058 TaxID=3346317 RepID=UPI0036DAFC28
MSGDNLFGVYGRMTALPGRRDELIAVLLAGLQAGGKGGGLLSFSINAAVDDSDTVWLTQLWVDKAAHDATTRSEPVAAVSRLVPALLAGQPEGHYGNTVHYHGGATGSLD